MIKELLQQKPELSLGQEEMNVQKMQQFWTVVDHPELSLGPSLFVVSESSNSFLSESEANPSRKRKYCFDHFKTEPTIQTSVELQLKDPLPLDWEQCLDLQSGKKYYLNRKTLKKTWNWPKDQKLDLELTISTFSSSNGRSSSSEMFEGSKKHNSSSSNMVAVACLKCHLLVMICKSSPFCPNCKYMNSLPTQQSPPPKTVRSLDTLSLLNLLGSNGSHESKEY